MLSRVRYLPLNGLESLKDEIIAYKDLILQKEESDRVNKVNQDKHVEGKLKKKNLCSLSGDQKDVLDTSKIQQTENSSETKNETGKACLDVNDQEHLYESCLSCNQNDFSLVTAESSSAKLEKQNQDDSLECLLPGIVERRKREEWEESVKGSNFFL